MKLNLFRKKILLSAFIISVFVILILSLNKPDTIKLTEQANSFFENGEFIEAKDTLLQVLLSEPNNEEANYLLANVYYALNQIDQAEEYILKALSFNPDREHSYNLLFDIYMKQGKVKEAETLILDTIKKYPNNTRNQIDLAKLNIEKKNYDDSIKILNKVLILNPDDPYAYSYLGIAYYYSEDYENALFNFNKSKNFVETGYENPNKFACPYEGLGITFYQLGDEDKSIEYLSKSIDLRPGVINEKYYTLTKIYLKNSEYDKAFEIVDKWVQYSPEDKEIINELLLNYSVSDYTFNE